MTLTRANQPKGASHCLALAALWRPLLAAFNRASTVAPKMQSAKTDLQRHTGVEQKAEAESEPQNPRRKASALHRSSLEPTPP